MDDTTASERERLKPCPFCGHVGLDFQEGSTFRWLAYSCGGCGMGSETRVQTLGDGTKEQWRAAAEADAIREWNTRAALPAPADQVLVPKRLTRAMREVLEEEGWTWEDLLAAAEAITEAEHTELSAASSEAQEIPGYVRDWIRGKDHP